MTRSAFLSLLSLLALAVFTLLPHIEDNTGYDRVVENLRHGSADIKGPESPEEVQY